MQFTAVNTLTWALYLKIIINITLNLYTINTQNAQEAPMNARVYIGLKLLFANEVGSQEPVSSKNLQDKNIPKPANPAKKRNYASIHIYSNMLPKLRPEKSAIYIHIYISH